MKNNQFMLVDQKLTLPSFAPSDWKLKNREWACTETYIIIDRWGNVLYEWADKIIPTFWEVCRVCNILMQQKIVN